MASDPLIVTDLLERPFVIHALDSYTHLGLPILADSLGLAPSHMQKHIRTLHDSLVRKLAAGGVDYLTLRHALTPQRGRHEVAFVFDSTAAGSNSYGHAISQAWLPTLRDHGPAKSSIHLGDILDLSAGFVWAKLDELLVRRRDFPRLSSEQYYVVYLTNLSTQQLSNIDSALQSRTDAYLGYVDCSSWNPLKAGMLLPQFGLRHGSVIVTACDDGGYANLPGYPVEEFGFTVLGIDEDLYGPLLSYRLDNGVPEWADEDSAMALSVLGGSRRPAVEMNLIIDESRIEYLAKDHARSMETAGLSGLDRTELIKAIRTKFTNNLIFNLRFIPGAREGVPAPELDAMMFTVQVEFPDETTATVRRYQVAIKYLPALHTGELVTFY